MYCRFLNCLNSLLRSIMHLDTTPPEAEANRIPNWLVDVDSFLLLILDIAHRVSNSFDFFFHPLLCGNCCAAFAEGVGNRFFLLWGVPICLQLNFVGGVIRSRCLGMNERKDKSSFLFRWVWRCDPSNQTALEMRPVSAWLAIVPSRGIRGKFHSCDDS